MLALPIFPVRLQTSIFGRSELNFRVRNGNGWTLALISTYYFNHRSDQNRYEVLIGDPYGNRTHVCGVRGRRLNRLTNGPCHASPVHDARLPFVSDSEQNASRSSVPPRYSPFGLLTTARRFVFGAPSGIRTRDPLIKSQLLYQLS